MRWACLLAVLSLTSLSVIQADEPETGFKPIFNGQNLNGWQGKDGFWKVVDGAIVGETTPEQVLDKNTFLVWDQGPVDDFELRLKFRISGSDKANSGIQFRGVQRPDGHVVGYQADIDLGGEWIGALYDEAARGTLAKRGVKTRVEEDGKLSTENIADPAALLASIKPGDWNEYSIKAQGNRITLKINDVVMSEVIDDDPKGLDRSGILALQLHTGPPMKIEFKEIRLKRFPLQGGWKKAVFIAGKPSHGYSQHEHNAGCLLLASHLKEAEAAGLQMINAVYLNGWPQDPTALDNADTVVAYCDGGERHFLNPNVEEFDELVKTRKVGLVCLHYGVETTQGEKGNAFLRWIGGYFEPHWSVNPHWVANFEKIPVHPVTRGVRPFEINDEWYYHMRFVPNMTGVTPLLTALPPRETLNRRDGPHSGNPEVRAAVMERKEPQHMAWAYDRLEGQGRGFGFTGGHFHANWQHDDFRRLVLNAIVWTAQGEVPQNGVTTHTPSVPEMEANHDKPKPKNFQFKSPIKATAPEAGAAKDQRPSASSAKPAFRSGIVTAQTPGGGVDINVDITGAKSLYLVVLDAGDGIGCDWADWEKPRLVHGQNSSEKKLTELKWASASAGHGAVRINRNSGNEALRSQGRELEFGLGTHSNSVIEYTLPDGHGFTRFLARGVLDEGGTNQGCGSSVQFLVFTEKPGPEIFRQPSASGNPASHESSVALEQLQVHPSLKATLFASEPMMSNPTSIDIDHLGRVWVCEGVNYRAFANKDLVGTDRPGDRLLILEDLDHNGVADKASVFYQGHDIDSAHGILILPTVDGVGTRVLISAGDSIFYLIDEDGDLKADKKEFLFTGISGAQHDHGIHAVHFGPDGKLYFNFGNYGKHVKDRDGKPIIDTMGNEVNDSRKPYQEGMVFRCNLDGSEFETLGWNFRNNWEVCLDSFGTVWQSDNDDDGNRGVRLNFVMEYGNYGYRDELTGASWQTPRTNWESEIPLRHWHLNDPGVVPNLIQTGAGAPTGICFNEGNLLPAELRGAIIHCDAGSNSCRAYIPKPDGAGYSAEPVDLLIGTLNRWFRPSDACIAPDGSVMVADWYDPGVGGHRMQDIEHGRIFRLAPPTGARYQAPKYDFSTPQGAVKALQSPNMATRYLAWTTLQKFGREAVEPLNTLWNSKDPVLQARALWLLGKLDRPHAEIVETLRAGLAHADPNIRITAIRLLRQSLKTISLDDVNGAITANDTSAGVLREILIALRQIPKSWYPADLQDRYAAAAWTKLAERYQGDDRWYLEALGIAAASNWDKFLSEWLSAIGADWKNTKAGRDIVWRSRAKQTSKLLAELITSPVTPLDEIPRYFRALDFQQPADRQAVIEQLALATDVKEADRRNLIRSESLARLGDVDFSKNPKLQEVVDQCLADCEGTSQFVALVGRFSLQSRYPQLIQLTQTPGNPQLSVDAIAMLFEKNQQKLVREAIEKSDRAQSEETINALGTWADKRALALLLPILTDEARPMWMRQSVVKALGASNSGGSDLLKFAKGDVLQGPLAPALAASLLNSSNPAIRDAASKLFPSPPGKNSTPLPPIGELANRKGNADQGRIIFNTTGTCNKCHQVNGIGVEIGPNLSEIGKKLARPAMYEAILFPSAAISHGYENWSVVTDAGQVYTGLIINETPTEIQMKDDKGIIRKIPVEEIEVRRKQDVSLMPADLQRLMTVEELVDVVEYMTTLKERRL